MGFIINKLQAWVLGIFFVWATSSEYIIEGGASKLAVVSSEL